MGLIRSQAASPFARTWPAVSRQISGPVVRRWMSGLAGFSNCSMQERGGGYKKGAKKACGLTFKHTQR